MKRCLPTVFLPERIRQVVEPDRPGVYALGDVENGGLQVKYIGRSDSCVMTRLLTHNYLYAFSYFFVQYARSPEEAFRLESRWWHSCREAGVPLYNRVHPDAPANSGALCPYCTFAEDSRRSGFLSSLETAGKRAERR